MSVYLVQLYIIDYLKKLSLWKSVMKLQEGFDFIPPIDLLTIEKKIVSGFYNPEVHLLVNDLERLLSYLKIIMKGKKALEEFETKMRDLLLKLKQKKL